MFRHEVGKALKILVKSGDRLITIITNTSNGQTTEINDFLHKMFKMLAMLYIMSILTKKMEISIRSMAQR
jgi:hypothetical protein